MTPWQMYTFFKWKFCEEFKYATYLLLNDKLKIENAEILTDSVENIEHSVSLYRKTIMFIISSLVLKARAVLNISDVVLQIGNLTVTCG